MPHVTVLTLKKPMLCDRVWGLSDQERCVSGCPPEAGPPSAENGALSMACVYILKSSLTGKKYVGSSREENASFRLREHNIGSVRSTKAGRPWMILHQEKLATYTEARKRENFLKSGQGRLWINKNLDLERCVSG